MHLAKQVLYSALKRRGLELRATRYEGWWPHKLRPLSNAATVIDVGVWRGTPELYAAFPDAFLLLVDPLPEAEPYMRSILASRRGKYEAIAVGDGDGMAMLKVTHDTSSSTLHHRTSQEAHFAVEGEIEVRTTSLDALVDRHNPPGTILLKIDVEGHELAVLEGAASTLERTDCVIAELSIARRFSDSYSFAEIVRSLDAAGFALADLLTIYREEDTTTRRVDAAFVRA